uniref:DNA 3'-5' helicase n=2 Tax=Clytia hemisphaerica TaxID=252671 RepID=A0A7M5TXI0_9CNID
MTATATKSTREFIISNLQMITPELLIMAPGKSNITYYVKKTKNLDCDTLFAPLIKNLRDNGYKAERVIIFCDRSRLRDLYDSFENEFYNYYTYDERPFAMFHRTTRPEIKERIIKAFQDPDGMVRILIATIASFENEFYNDYTYDERPFAMFHRTTRPEIKERIIKAFQDPDGMVRILIATIAFGMGIDCKDLHRIIHFGVPSDLDSYFQESGRAGRDDAQCSALLLLYPRCISRYVKKDIRDYVTNTQRCRREIHLEVYDSKPSKIQPKHTCCDFCHQRCECGNCESPEFLVDLLQSRDEIELPDNELINDEVEEQVECREGESESEPEIENDEH